MKEYQFQATIEPDNYRSVKVINDNDEAIGCIEKDVLKKCEEKYTYSFTKMDGHKVTLGLKRRKFRDLNIANYIIASEGRTIFLKEKAGKNLLRFRVKGKVDSRQVYIKEDEEGNMIVLIDGRLTSTVVEHSPEKVAITVEDDVKEDDIIFGIMILMFFMFKLYKREPWHIEELLS